MAKNFEHLIHKNSNVTTNGNPKLPTSSQIEYGELAVNYAKDKETISLKNANNEIVSFSSDKIVWGKTLRIMGVTPVTHTLADATDSYYADALNDGEVGAWFISYSNGDLLVKPSTQNDESGRIKLSSGWASRLNYGGMTWANVGDILLVYRQSSLICAYKILSINEAGETRIGLMSPNDKVQVNKISNIETALTRKLPYSTDSTNIGNVGDGAYTNVTSGRTNWLDSTSAGAAIKLGNLQIAVDTSGRIYSRNQTTNNGTWNITNQLYTIGGTNLDSVFVPSVVGYGVCQNGPTQNPLTVYTFTSSDLDGNGFRSILQVAIDRTDSTPYIRTTFYKPADNSFTKTNWVKIPNESDFVTVTEFDNTEKAIAAALNDLNQRVGSVSTDIEEMDLVVSSALNDLDSRVEDLDSSVEDLDSRVEYLETNGSGGGAPATIQMKAVWDSNGGSTLEDFDFVDAHEAYEIYTQNEGNVLFVVETGEMVDNNFVSDNTYLIMRVTDIVHNNTDVIVCSIYNIEEKYTLIIRADSQNEELVVNRTMIDQGGTGASHILSSEIDELEPGYDNYYIDGSSATASDARDLLLQNAWMIRDGVYYYMMKVVQVSENQTDYYLSSVDNTDSLIRVVKLTWYDNRFNFHYYYTFPLGGGGGGEANVIESISVNGTTQTITSKNVDITVPTALSSLSDDTTHRLVTDTEKTSWSGKQNALTFDGTYNASTNKAATVSTVTNAINALDGGTIGTGGTGKTITSLSQSNGNVSATFSDISITKSQVSDFPTTMTPASHTHGNISNTGTLTDTAAAAAGNDYVVIRDASDSKIQTSTIKGTDVADAVSKKHEHSTLTLSTTAQAYDGTHTLALPSSDPYSSARTPTAHNQASNTITAMTGYSKGSSGAAVAATDTLNAAISKLENQIDTKTSNTGTITGINMNGSSKGTSGVVDLGTVITSETTLSKGTTTGSGNAVTDISVNNHQITLTKGTTFLTSHQSIKTLNGTALTGTGNITLTGVPAFTSADNGKILGVVNGQLAWVTPTTIYTGTGTPSSSQGNDGDIYLQTS